MSYLCLFLIFISAFAAGVMARTGNNWVFAAYLFASLTNMIAVALALSS